MRLRRVVFLILLVPLDGCGSAEAGDAGLAIYEDGRAVALDRARSAALGDSARHFFHRCLTWEAVVGRPLAQGQLQEEWRLREAAVHAVLEERAGADPPFDHLAGREYLLLLGLDPATGVTSVMTKHDDLLTRYLKCPGLEAMELGCTLSRELAARDPWPVCAAVARVPREMGR